MPLYEYQCDDCGHRFERIQKFSDALETTCPACGGAVRKLLSSPAIQFKGSGWYITDYARKPASEKAADGKDDAKKPAGADASAKDTKDQKDKKESVTSTSDRASKPSSRDSGSTSSSSSSSSGASASK